MADIESADKKVQSRDLAMQLGDVLGINMQHVRSASIVLDASEPAIVRIERLMTGAEALAVRMIVETYCLCAGDGDEA